MANTLSGMANSLRRFAKQLPESVNEVKKDVAAAILTNLATSTPVDVGEAMSSWMVTTNQPSTVMRDAHDPSPKGRVINGVWTHKVDPVVTREANIDGTLRDGMNEIEMAKPGETIFITNNQPYIQPLDNGYSSQAPADFVEAALVAGKEKLSMP